MDEVNKRVRILRTEYLKISQEKLGKTIGISQSTVNSIEKSECKLTDRNLKAICDTHNVREEWLRTGEEPIFLPSKDKILIDKVAEEFNLSDVSKSIIETYLSLSEESQKSFEEFVFKLVPKIK